MNSNSSISQTISSVLGQHQRGLEYIIVDGSSTDGTQETVKSFGNAVDVFISEPDRGIADAFNKGILHSSGVLVGLINADDCLLPGAIEKVITYFATHPDVDVLHGDVLLYDGAQLIKRIQPAGRWWYPWRLVIFNHPATFVRRSVYEKCGFFDTGYKIAMDVEIFLRWMRKGICIAYVPDVFVAMQAGGVSGRSAFGGYREVKRAFSTYGFPSLVVTIQFICKFGVQFIVTVQSNLRTLKRNI